jgi:hypothetical protein
VLQSMQKLNAASPAPLTQHRAFKVGRSSTRARDTNVIAGADHQFTMSVETQSESTNETDRES